MSVFQQTSPPAPTGLSAAPFSLLASSVLPWPHRFLHYETTTLLPFLLLRLPLLLLLWAICEQIGRRLLGLHKNGPGFRQTPALHFITMVWVACGPLMLLSSLWWRLGGNGWASFTSVALRLAAASSLWVWPDFDQGMATTSSFLFRYVARWWRLGLTCTSLVSLLLKAWGLPLLPLEDWGINACVATIMTKLPRRPAVALARLGTWAYLTYFLIAFLPHCQLLTPNLEAGKPSSRAWWGFRINQDRRCLPLSQRFRWPREGEPGTFAAAPRDDPWYEHDRALKDEQKEQALYRSRLWAIHEMREEMVKEGKDPDAEYEAVVKAERGKDPPLLSQSAGYHRYLSLVLGQRKPDVRDLSLLRDWEEGGDEAVLRSNLVRYRMFLDRYVANNTLTQGLQLRPTRPPPAVPEGEFFLVDPPEEGDGGGDQLKKGLDDANVLESLLMDEWQGGQNYDEDTGAGVGATLFDLAADTRFRLSPGAMARLGVEGDEEQDEEEGDDYDSEYEDEYTTDGEYYDGDPDQISGFPGALPVKHGTNALELRRSPLMSDPTYRFSLLHPDETVFNASLVGVYMSQLPQTIYTGLVLDVLREVQAGPVGTWARGRCIPMGYLTATLTQVLSSHLQYVTVAVSDAMLFPMVPVRHVVPINLTLVKDNFERSLRMDAPDSFYQEFNCTAVVGARWMRDGKRRVKKVKKTAIPPPPPPPPVVAAPGAEDDESEAVIASSRLTYGRAWATARDKRKSLWKRMGEGVDGLVLRLESLVSRNKKGRRKKDDDHKPAKAPEGG